uniref:Transposase n=1 Tax=Heterorhabditis bacteriophora TaxID=37862 RepID=A0A1I7XVT3_HETBA
MDEVCVNLYREGDLKKKKDRSTLIGYVLIGINQLTSRHPVERWLVVWKWKVEYLRCFIKCLDRVQAFKVRSLDSHCSGWKNFKQGVVGFIDVIFYIYAIE